MPSGAKKRRAAKRKQQEKAQPKQTDELATVSVVKVTIPIEELVKGAVWHETDSVDKELVKAKNTIGEISDEFKVASVVDDNEMSLLDVTSNVDYGLSNDESLVTQNAGCIIGSVESDENLNGNESCGVVCNVSKETELLFGAPEQNFEQGHDNVLMSVAKTPGEMLKGDHDLLSGNDSTTLDSDKNRGFSCCLFGGVTEVEVLAANEAASVSKELKVAKHTVQEVFDEVKDVYVLESSFEESEEVLFKVAAKEDCEVSKYETVVPQNADCTIESTSKYNESLPVGSPMGMMDTAPLPSVTGKVAEYTSKFNELRAGHGPPEEVKDTNLMTSNVSCVSKEIDKASMFNDFSIEASDGMEVTKQQVSTEGAGFFLPGFVLPVVLDQPSSSDVVRENALSAENTGCSSAEILIVSDQVLAVPKGVVSLANESQETEVPSDSEEVLVVPTGTVPPTAGLACPMHCNSDCSYPQLLRGQLMDSVVELKSAVLSLKGDLQKALDKLDTILY